MNTSQPQTGDDVAIGLRKAALLLHAVSQADRQWLLGRVDDARREQLSSLIDEIETLGIPADYMLVRDVVELPRSLALAFGADSPAAHGSDEAFDAIEHLFRVVDAAAPARLAQILRDEPAGLIASLLDMYPWSWRHAVLSQLGVVRRRQIEELSMLPRASADAAPAPALRVFLLSAIERKLEALPLAQPVAGPTEVRQSAGRFELARSWRRFIEWRRLSKARS
ncbi:hypothetical protein BWP39_29060 [Paraburkholderia acidicola]|uniref:Uncharacterized protein n=2 Tax=Paraburkholderia acidicola TaxID=1912599 RepID=A0A2A4ERH5_9BURK|nr:hypothetical protein BWP39_29060 [Paraburkholderia acidicola]